MAAQGHGRVRSAVVLVVGLALVALPGFALGLLAGVGWEDPSLLIGHLLGRTEEAPWGTPEGEASGPPSSQLPDVAARTVPAPPPVPEAPSAAAPTPAAPAPAAAAARPAAERSTAAPQGRFAVQVGAFGESRAAEQLARTLRGKGFDVYVSPGATAPAARWRVRVGPFPSRPEAEAAAARLKSEQKLPTWVLDENGPA